jgi:hypothetical protein
MNSELSKQYLSHYIRIKDCEKSGKLNSLLDIYNDYGRPKYMSPRRVTGYKTFRDLIEYVIRKANNDVDRVIKYDDRDILVNCDLAIAYLNRLDVKNDVLMMFFLQQFHGREELLKAFFDRFM